ncbi:Sporulation kinase A [compost metagenome]
MYAIKGDKNAIIFSTGFIIFALLGVGELLYYYLIDRYYSLFLWKWGIACFLSSLIIILGRTFAENHQRIVEYSKQLETFNNELQRAERMEIISELAASVAHEVRNPLQVTRGFIQLLVEKQPASEKVYLNMALEELDRASDIITDYLTFAKPEAGKITNLNVLDEFIHIEGILIPMANMQGGNIFVHIPNDLFIKGNSSKFKQAFINIIKNSIEALNGEGEVQIWAYEENEKVHIHIKDTGEGMDEAVLARLGEPYFSNKTKGTGLGLMVTLRIIEVMDGTIKFSSQKGVGTEVVIQFPKACIHADEEDEQSTQSLLES